MSYYVLNYKRNFTFVRMNESCQSYNTNDIMVYTLLCDIHYCTLLLFVNMYKVNKVLF